MKSFVLEVCVQLWFPIHFSAGISTTNLVANNPVYYIDLGDLYDDETVVAGSKSKVYCLNKVDATIFCDSFWAQIDNRVGVSILNLISLLHNVKFFNMKFKINVCIHGITSKQIITPHAVGYMRICALTRQGFIDIKFYYLSQFSTTLPLYVSVIETAGQPVLLALSYIQIVKMLFSFFVC